MHRQSSRPAQSRPGTVEVLGRVCDEAFANHPVSSADDGRFQAGRAANRSFEAANRAVSDTRTTSMSPRDHRLRHRRSHHAVAERLRGHPRPRTARAPIIGRTALPRLAMWGHPTALPLNQARPETRRKRGWRAEFRSNAPESRAGRLRKAARVHAKPTRMGASLIDFPLGERATARQGTTSSPRGRLVLLAPCPLSCPWSPDRSLAASEPNLKAFVPAVTSSPRPPFGASERWQRTDPLNCNQPMLHETSCAKKRPRSRRS
jgi:hypothetical protein